MPDAIAELNAIAKSAQWDHGYHVSEFFDADPYHIQGPYPRLMCHVSNDPFDEHGRPLRKGQVYAAVMIYPNEFRDNKDHLRELIAAKIESAILCVKDRVSCEATR